MEAAAEATRAPAADTMVNVKSSMLIFVAFAVISEVTVALLPPFAYTAAQAIMGKSYIYVGSISFSGKLKNN